MSREIKFRAWDENNQRMLYQNKDFGYIGITFDGVPFIDLLKVDSITKGTQPVYQANVTQFTGLYDKAGTPIYEGDILDNSYINPMSQEKVTRLFEIIYEDGCHKAKCIGHSPYGDTLLYFKNKTSEVIGNIYESPTKEG